MFAGIVALRTREYGIRSALGAAPGQVRTLVLARGALLAAGGLVLGGAGALALTRFLGALLYGVTAGDALTFSAGASVLALAALGACGIPARLASRVDPAIVLRPE